MTDTGHSMSLNISGITAHNQYLAHKHSADSLVDGAVIGGAIGTVVGLGVARGLGAAGGAVLGAAAGAMLDLSLLDTEPHPAW